MSLTNLFEWVQQLTPDRLPPVPWLLHPKVAVSENDKFLHSLQHEAKRPDILRGKNGALHADLRAVYQIVTSGKHEPAPWAGKFVTAEPEYRIEARPKKQRKR